MWDAVEFAHENTSDGPVLRNVYAEGVAYCMHQGALETERVPDNIDKILRTDSGYLVDTLTRFANPKEDREYGRNKRSYIDEEETASSL